VLGSLSLVVLLVLASAALLLWAPTTAQRGAVGMALLGLGALLGGAHSAHRAGRRGLAVGACTGLTLAFLATGVAYGAVGVVPPDWPVRLGAAAVAGALGGVWGVGGGE
jgi:putative membrane protein (TIGR04086 family)